MEWMFVLFVLVGDYMIVKRNRTGFYAWVLVDGYFSVSNFCKNDYIQASVFALYAIMGIYGLSKWKTKEKE